MGPGKQQMIHRITARSAIKANLLQWIYFDHYFGTRRPYNMLGGDGLAGLGIFDQSLNRRILSAEGAVGTFLKLGFMEG